MSPILYLESFCSCPFKSSFSFCICICWVSWSIQHKISLAFCSCTSWIVETSNMKSHLHFALGGGCCERQNVCIFDISFLQKIPNPVLSRTKHCCFCNKSNHCAFSTALPMSYIDTLFQPKQTWIIDKNNKTNKCKCLSKECSIALKMYRLYISTGVSLNICNSSFGHVHSKQVPIYAICSL